jgi:small subunit ribosomal protein S20
VAHSLSAKKRVRQQLKRHMRNRRRKELIKDQVRMFTSALTAGDANKAKAELSKTASRLDKVAAKGTIHKNTAARKRSRLARRLNAMIAAGPKAATTGKGSKAAKG